MSTFSRFILVSVCLVGAALLLFLHTVNEMRATSAKKQYTRPWRLMRSSPPLLTSTPPSVLPSPQSTSSPSSLSLPHSDIDIVAAIFRRQARQRKSLFERALRLESTRKRSWFEWAFDSWSPSIIAVLESIAPEAYCPSIARIGSVADGGKWVCNPWAIPKTAASQSSIEGLSQINAVSVHAMIAETTDLSEDLMKKMGHDHIEILKMDIEGAELTVLPLILKRNSILLEIHNIAETPKVLRTVAKAGFLLQKYELSTHGLKTGVCEYSFIHESCIKKYGATLLASYLKQ